MITHVQPAEFTIVPRGPFSLEATSTLRFGHRLEAEWDGVMRLAFCVDGYRDQVGVEVRQDGDGVHCIVRTNGSRLDQDVVRGQVARVLSLDHDAREYVAVCERDPVIRRLQAAAPGLRPALFYSPYEAAAWAVLSARRPAAQMAEVRRLLSAEHGQTFQLAGEQLAAFPTPERLVGVREFAGLSAEKVRRLHAVAEAAQAGQLDAARLRAMAAEEATTDVQSIPGIGPFYASLIVIRSTGCADVLPTTEPRLIALVTTLYDLPAPPTAAVLLEIAESWRPFRTWVAVLVRAAGGPPAGA